MSEYPCTLYVLQLKDKKWYVGSTVCSGAYRVQQHRDGYGSKWTSKHPLVRVATQYFVSAERAQHEENMVWWWLAERYGAHNVRGGDVTIATETVPDWCLPIEFGGTRIVDWV